MSNKQSGGTSLLPGLQDRLHKEIGNVAPTTARIQIIAPNKRNHATWIGGSIVASLSTFKTECISKAQYEEVGPSVIHHKIELETK